MYEIKYAIIMHLHTKQITLMHRIKYGLFIPIACISFSASAGIIEHFNTIKSDPKALYAFFKGMPTGGELHYHFDGSSSPETMLSFAARGDYCLDPETFTLSHFKTVCHDLTAKQLLKNQPRFEQTIRAWSMKDFSRSKGSPINHFYSAFAKAGTIQSDFDTHLLANIMERAANQHELYLEMIALHLEDDKKYAKLIQSAANMAEKKRILLANPDFQNSINRSIHESNRLLTQSRKILDCDSMPEKAACSLTVKFQYYVNREESLDQVFAQALAGFVTATQSNDIVGVNMVGAEHGVICLHDYKAHMDMFNFLHTAYPKVHIALHAGEISPRLAKPKDLSFHIHDAVFTGQAERIGHGVDITHEDDLTNLLNYMAKKPVAVEINLTSNRELLNIYGKKHPLRFYLKHHVPVVLSTDDEGILRTDLTHEYVDAVIGHKLDYPTIKAINRNTLTYSFLPGKSLWADAQKQIIVPECQHLSSTVCQAFIKESLKATLQWTLEEKLRGFETSY